MDGLVQDNSSKKCMLRRGCKARGCPRPLQQHEQPLPQPPSPPRWLRHIKAAPPPTFDAGSSRMGGNTSCTSPLMAASEAQVEERSAQLARRISPRGLITKMRPRGTWWHGCQQARSLPMTAMYLYRVHVDVESDDG